jgi:hypothetical protein
MASSSGRKVERCVPKNDEELPNKMIQEDSTLQSFVFHDVSYLFHGLEVPSSMALY